LIVNIFIFIFEVSEEIIYVETMMTMVV